MASGTGGLSYKDLADNNQVPSSNLEDDSNNIFFPLARLVPRVAVEKTSLDDLVMFLNQALVFVKGLEQAAVDRGHLTQSIVNEVAERTALSGTVEDHTHDIGSLTQRVAALESGSGGGVMPPQTRSSLVIGLFDTDGNKKADSEQTLNFVAVSYTHLTLPTKRIV